MTFMLASEAISKKLVDDQIQNQAADQAARENAKGAAFSDLLQDMAGIMAPVLGRASGEAVTASGGTTIATAVSAVSRSDQGLHINPVALSSGNDPSVKPAAYSGGLKSAGYNGSGSNGAVDPVNGVITLSDSKNGFQKTAAGDLPPETFPGDPFPGPGPEWPPLPNPVPAPGPGPGTPPSVPPGGSGNFDELRQLLEEMQQKNAELFSIQLQAQAEMQHWSAKSNIARTIHEAAMTIIRNMRLT